MSRTIHQRQDARRDFLEIYARLAQDDERVADRFYARAESTMQLVSGLPDVGVAVNLTNPSLKGLRRIAVQGFKNYLIFYIPTDTEIDVVRVLHGSRNTRAILEAE